MLKKKTNTRLEKFYGYVNKGTAKKIQNNFIIIARDETSQSICL